MKSWLFLVLSSTSFFTNLAHGRTYPRTILSCGLDMEGRFDLSESGLGNFEFSESHGFDGSGPRGNVKVKLTQSTVGENSFCSMELSATDGTFRKNLKWLFNKSPKTPIEVSLEEFGGKNCPFSSRYQNSIAECQLPTVDEPGTNCYKEPSEDYTTLLDFGLVDSKQTKLITYPGGFTVDGYFAAWISYKERNHFCIEIDKDARFPDHCETMITAPMEIRDRANSLLGIVKPDGDNLILTNAIGETLLTFSAQNQLSSFIFGNGSKVTLKGNLQSPQRFRSYWKPVPLLEPKEVVVDCNGPQN